MMSMAHHAMLLLGIHCTNSFLDFTRRENGWESQPDTLSVRQASSKQQDAALGHCNLSTSAPQQ